MGLGKLTAPREAGRLPKVTRAFARFWTLAIVLLSWQAPAWASIGVGLHLASDHHRLAPGVPPEAPAPTEVPAPAEVPGETLALELALAASHGHHHDLDSPAHDHPALRIVAASALAPGAVDCAPAVSWARALAGPATGVRREPPCSSPPPTGPPELFYRHCALLL